MNGQNLKQENAGAPRSVSSPQDDENGIQYSEVWSSSNAVDFYTTSRNSLRDVYNSEKHFLAKCIRPGLSILDVGCAAGGFFTIFSSLEMQISYTGIDISPRMIRQARDLHHNTPFVVGDAGTLPFRDRSFDLVYCSGAIHMSLNWQNMISECWRVTRNLFIFDVRLVENRPSIQDISRSYEKIAFNNKWDGKSIVPYIILSDREFIESLHKLIPSPEMMHFFGYYHPVSPMTVAPYREVCMSMCCLGKNKGKENHFLWEMPIQPPKDIWSSEGPQK